MWQQKDRRHITNSISKIADAVADGAASIKGRVCASLQDQLERLEEELSDLQDNANNARIQQRLLKKKKARIENPFFLSFMLSSAFQFWRKLSFKIFFLIYFPGSAKYTLSWHKKHKILWNFIFYELKKNMKWTNIIMCTQGQKFCENLDSYSLLTGISILPFVFSLPSW